MIPMVDLKRQYSRLKNEIDRAVGQALEQTQFILDPTSANWKKRLPHIMDCLTP